MKYIHLIIVLLVVCNFSVFGQKAVKHIREGNKLYYDSAFTQSEIEYRKALEEKESDKARFNLAGSLYKQQRFDEAREIYDQLAQNETDKLKLSGYHYNLGNTYLKSGKLQESIDAYKSALRYNPDDVAAKYNLSYALKMKQQQQQQNQQNQDQQNQQDNQKQEDQQQQDQKENQEQEQNNKQEQQQQDEQQRQPEEQQEQQPEKAEISEEDARRLLEALENEEKELQQKILEKQKAKPTQSDKNW